MNIDELRELAGLKVPLFAPRAEQWFAVESDLGLRLPNELKTLISTIGEGAFGDLHLFNPCSPYPFRQFSRSNAQVYHDNLKRNVVDSEYVLYPEPSGLLQVGHSGNRIDLLIQLMDSQGDSYRTVWFHEDYYEEGLIVLDVGIPRCLCDLFSGRMHEKWSTELRDLLWEEDEPFFTTRYVEEYLMVYGRSHEHSGRTQST